MIILIARKKIEGSSIENIKSNGCGAIHIDACRVGDEIRFNASAGTDNRLFNSTLKVSNEVGRYCVGRFPANVVLSKKAAPTIDGQNDLKVSEFFKVVG